MPIDVAKILVDAEKPPGKKANTSTTMASGSGGNSSDDTTRLALATARMARLAFDSSSLVLLVNSEELKTTLASVKDQWHKSRPKLTPEALAANRRADESHPMGGGRTAVLVCVFLDRAMKASMGTPDVHLAAKALLAMEPSIHTAMLVDLVPKYAKPRPDRKWVWTLTFSFFATEAYKLQWSKLVFFKNDDLEILPSHSSQTAVEKRIWDNIKK
jgi:hypothetical protein